MTCPNSGKINSLKANFTALGEPGSKKTAFFLIFPAVALDNIAAGQLWAHETISPVTILNRAAAAGLR